MQCEKQMAFAIRIELDRCVCIHNQAFLIAIVYFELAGGDVSSSEFKVYRAVIIEDVVNV